MYQGDLEPFGLGLWYGEGFIYQGGLEPLASAFDTVMGCEYQWDRPPLAEVYDTLVHTQTKVLVSLSQKFFSPRDMQIMHRNNNKGEKTP